MPMRVDYVPNANLEQTQPWSSINTKTGVYKQGPDQLSKMNAAMQTNSMATPAFLLRQSAPLNVVAVPSTQRQATLDDVLNRTAGVPPQMSIFDYSGVASGRLASSQPSISV